MDEQAQAKDGAWMAFAVSVAAFLAGALLWEWADRPIPTRSELMHVAPLALFLAGVAGAVVLFVVDRLRRRAASMAEGEARFRSLLESSSDEYWEQDTLFRFTLVGSQLLQKWGFDPQDDIGRTRWERGDEVGVSEEGWEAHRAMLARHEPFRGFEYGRVNSSGKTNYYSINGSPVFDRQGVFKGYRGTAQDITARKQAELDLRQALLLQTAIVDNAIVGILLTKDRAIARCNRSWEQIFGAAPGSLIGKSARFMYHSDEDYESYGKKVYEALSAGRGWSDERQFRRVDGSEFWCYYAGNPVDPGDPSQGVIWIAQDISGRKQTEAELQQVLLEQNAILDNATTMILLVKDRKIVRCNRFMEQMLGYQPGELEGKPTRIYYPSDAEYERLGNAAYPVISAGKVWAGDQQLMRKDGSCIWVAALGSYVDVNDPSKGAIWVVQDMTDRKLAEVALRQAMLEQSALLDNSEIGIAFVKNRVVQTSNAGMQKILGYSSEEMKGMPTRNFYQSQAEYEAIGKALQHTSIDGKVFIADLQFVRKDGSKVWCSFHAKSMSAPEEGAVCVVQDITAHKENEEELIAAKRELEQGLADVEQTYREVQTLSEMSSFLQACQTVQEACDCIATFGPRLFQGSDGAIYLADDLSNGLLGHSGWGGVDKANPQISSADCWAMRRGQPYSFVEGESKLRCEHLDAHAAKYRSAECIPLIAQGETFGLLVVRHRAKLDGEARNEMRHRLSVSLAEHAGLALANIRLRESLHRQSVRDPLTGLFNRRYMNDTFVRELSRVQRNKTALAVAIIDVDHFKRFNDTFGHDAGDVVLQSIAAVLESQVRQVDIVCRLGGEEFVVLLPEIQPDQAKERADTLLDAVRVLELQHKGQSLGRITASLGLAFYPDHGQTPDDLIAAADSALYTAKGEGRDRVVVCSAAQVAA